MLGIGCAVANVGTLAPAGKFVAVHLGPVLVALDCVNVRFFWGYRLVFRVSPIWPGVALAAVGAGLLVRVLLVRRSRGGKGFPVHDEVH